MTEIILRLVIAVFCIFGVAEVIHILKQKILAPDCSPETRLVVYLSGDTPDLQLASVINEYNWCKRSKPGSITAVYSVIDETALSNCVKMAERHKVYICSLEQAEKRSILNLL